MNDALRPHRCPYCGEQILATAKKCKHCGEWLDESVRAAAGPSRAASVRTDDGILLVTFAQSDPRAIAGDVGEFFRRCGYRLESGSPQRATYGIGSDVWRVLFGAFARRYKFDVEVNLATGGVRLRVAKAVSGAMGGVLGYQAMKKETTRIFNGLRQLFAV